MDSVPPPPLTVRAWASARRIVKFLRQLPRTDVALVFAADGLSVVEKGLLCALARLAGRGVVVRLSSGYLPEQCEQSTLIRCALRLTLRSAHVVCAQGPAWAKFFARYAGSARKIVEIQNGIDVRRTASAGPRSGSEVVFVGWMHRDKGIYDLLDAFEALRPEFPSLRLTCAGGGGELEAFRAVVAARRLQDVVRLPGWVSRERVRELLAGADAFVLPSYYEGLPNAMLEAMAEATPVVVSRVGAVPDVVEDGISGFLVEPRDSVAIAEALRRLLCDPVAARQMGAAGRAEIERTFDIELVWRRYADALQRAAREVGRASSSWQELD